MKFYLRLSKRKEIRPGRLYLRVICNRQVQNVATPFYLHEQEWDPAKEQVVYPSDDNHRFLQVRKMEEKLTVLKHYLEDVVEILEEEGNVTTEKVITAFRCRLEGHSLRPFVETLTREMIQCGQERTARAYFTVLNCFLQFCGEEKTFEQLNAALLHRFEAHLKEKRLALNTISFYIRNLRAIYNKAIKARVFEPKVSNPFENVYTGVDKTTKRALTKKEISSAISDKWLEISEQQSDGIPAYHSPLNTHHLRDAQQLFAFSFYGRGISFADLAYLKKTDVQDGILYYSRKKTRAYMEVKLTPEMEHIIHYFEAKTKDSEYLLPVLFADKQVPLRTQYESALRVQNNRLHRIADICGLEKPLTTHVARHSWATIAREENTSLSVISESLGHRSEKTTVIYLASFNRTVLDKANEQVARAIQAAH